MMNDKSLSGTWSGRRVHDLGEQHNVWLELTATNE